MKPNPPAAPRPTDPDHPEAPSRTQKALAASEARYRALLDGIDDGYFEIDLAGNFSVVNAALCALLGAAPASLIGRNHREFTAPQTAKTVARIFKRLLRNGQRIRITDYEVLPQNGIPRTLEVSAGRLAGESGRVCGFRGMVRDVSDEKRASDRRRQLDAQHQQVQKMEAIETLAGEMALDFNNVLMSIQANACLMGMQMGPDSPFGKHLERINTSVDQGIHLTRQLLSFAKVGKFVVRPSDINAIVQRSASMFARNHKQIHFTSYLKSGLWRADVDRVQIGQALLTLFMRAADDMPDGGEISLASDNVMLDHVDLQPYGLPPGAYIRISVTDGGAGLDETARRRIFEPFFSARDDGEQRDLGMAAVYGILKSHAGLINVYSEVDQGTTFNLYLPVSQKESPDPAETDRKAAPRATVLLVDESEPLLRSAMRMLDEMGSHALTAATGADALDLYRAHQGEIDLVIMDAILPDMPAADLLAEIRDRNARAVVLLSSGYSRNHRINALLRQGFDGFIQKPFTRKLLARTLADARRPAGETVPKADPATPAEE